MCGGDKARGRALWSGGPASCFWKLLLRLLPGVLDCSKAQTVAAPGADGLGPHPSSLHPWPGAATGLAAAAWAWVHPATLNLQCLLFSP